MDPVTIEKLRAMKQYKRSHFLQTLIYYFTTVIVLCLIVLKGFPSLASSIKLSVTVSAPNMGSFIVCPKCLFVVCNMIVIYLVGESKLSGSSASASPASELYGEYVKLTRGNGSRGSRVERKQKKKRLEAFAVQEKVEVIEEGLVHGNEENEREKVKPKKGREEDFDGDQDELGLPADELNKKFEDFIARVNKQMWLEAQKLVQSGKEEL